MLFIGKERFKNSLEKKCRGMVMVDGQKLADCCTHFFNIKNLFLESVIM
jgi:hypothetical protein